MSNDELSPATSHCSGADAGHAMPDRGRSVGGDLPLATNPASSANDMAVHFSSESIYWETPQWLFDALDKEFGFTLDVCANSGNAKCEAFITEEQNALLKDWGANICWMNPPYGEVIGRFMAKAHNAANEGATVVCLVPARTDTSWWHKFAMKHEIRFLRGRVKFVGAADSAPFPSAIVVMRPSTFSLRSA